MVVLLGCFCLRVEMVFVAGVAEPRLSADEPFPPNRRRIVTFAQCSSGNLEPKAGLMMKPGGPWRPDPEPRLVNG